MGYKALSLIFVAVAVIVAVLSLVASPKAVIAASYVNHFFVVMIPILGVAALLKYILCCNKKCD